MSALANRPFVKMNGLGNEIVVVDLRDGAPPVTAREARAIARTMPYDQIMALHPGRDGADAAMRILNRDGSEVSACGNGTRCVAWLMMRETARDSLVLDTAAGPLVASAGTDPMSIAVDMGPPRFDWRQIPLARDVGDVLDIAIDTGVPGLARFAAASMGNPHAVFFVEDALAFDLEAIGSRLEHDTLFPERANISLAELTGPDHITLRVWERGAGITLACGTAACATTVLAHRRGLTGRRVRVTLPGGDLVIDWREADSHVLMTGPVELEFEGVFDPSIFAGAAA
jgi:diaminopimelate epimerase